MKKLPVFVLVGIIICSGAHAVFAEGPTKEPVGFVEEFFNLVKADKVSEAYDSLFAGSGIAEMKPQAMDMVKMQTESGLKLYGKILGFEKVKEERFGTATVRLVYILKSEKMPTVWEFYFYRPKANWFCANVLFNDQFQLLDSKN